MFYLYAVSVYPIIFYNLLFATTTTLKYGDRRYYSKFYFADGFELPGTIFSNRTKNRLMTPLRVDSAFIGDGDGRKLLIVAAEKNNSNGSNDVNENDDGSLSPLPPPRGIVLNSVVGGLTFAGGLMGFLLKGSNASLVAGSTFGGLLLLSAYLISKSSKNLSRKGNLLGSIVGGFLGYVMSKKYVASKKFIPAGLLAFLSAMNVLYNLVEINVIQSNKNRREKNSIVDNKEKTKDA